MVLSMGIEVEFFSIYNRDFSPRIIKPRKYLREKGEKFTSDQTVGSEYNSLVFYSIGEAFFLLKNGLRKFIIRNYHYSKNAKSLGIGLIGGWKDKPAGAHIHLGAGKKDIAKKEARALSVYIHDHLPFIIAMTANSPFWDSAFSRYASARLYYKGDRYCPPVKKNILPDEHKSEISYNSYLGKSATLEIRVCDSNLPEYLIAALLVVNVLALAREKGKRVLNSTTHMDYLSARESAIFYGTNAYLYWGDTHVYLSQYIDRFFTLYRKEILSLSVPREILDVFRYLKMGYGGADILRKSCMNLRKLYPKSWRKHFADSYSVAVSGLLNGGSVRDFAHRLHVRLPRVDTVKLGGHYWHQ